MYILRNSYFKKLNRKKNAVTFSKKLFIYLFIYLQSMSRNSSDKVMFTIILNIKQQYVADDNIENDRSQTRAFSKRLNKRHIL